MEEMKNLVIQTLETRGVLGQIRAKLRSSVFKIVDEQDQKSNIQMGCGLKWENHLLYKIKDTNVGGVISELIREFMEFLKMDYSLSVFIPECSISPERLKKDEILAKLGLSINNFNPNVPMLFFILHYFIDSIQSNPEKVYESLNKIAKTDIEKYSDENIMKNLYNYQANQFQEEDLQNQNDRFNTNDENYNNNNKILNSNENQYQYQDVQVTSDENNYWKEQPNEKETKVKN
jgi:lisH domain-containing protein FOPNL